MSKEKKLIPELRFPEFEGEWNPKDLEQCLKYLQPTPYLVQSTKYNDEYETPVLTAGKSFVLGYTDEKEGVFKENLPVIIFDDFTTASKFVDFPFKTKSSAMKILLAKNGSNIKFVYEIIQTLDYEIGVHKRHWISVFSKLKIALPQPKEQQKIASCLSSLDELIAAHNNELQALKDHKKGLMQNLFPQEGETVPKVRFPEFVNDREWNVRKLGEIANISKLAGYEFTKHVKYESTGRIIALRGLNIKNNSLDLTDVKYIDNSELSMLERSKLYIDDLMFTYIGTIGEVALIEENDRFYLAPNVSRIRPDKKKVIPQFLLQHFNIPRFKIFEVGKFISSSSQPALTMGNVRKFELNIPSLQEQQKIASCLSAIDELITAQTEKIEQLQQHKKGLMQGLFPKINN
ncbi:restriction endonuclease subunit S [Salegentibacter sp. F14]